MMVGPGWKVQLPVIFSVVIVSFVAATAFSQWRLSTLDGASRDIADNAAPSIERLAAVRGDMRRLQLLLREYLDRKAVGASADVHAIEEPRRSMDRSINEYLALPVFPGERALWGDILRAKDALDQAVMLCVSEADRGSLGAAGGLLRHEVAIAAGDLDTAVTKDIEFNAGHARDLALQIKQLRGGATSLAFGMNAACVLVTVAGAVALRRAMRAHTNLAERHQRLLEARASELEKFAGTVAHDILSPLGAVGLSLELVGRSGDEASRARSVARGLAALGRVKLLVHDLLEFARAGAKPDPSAQSDVGGTLADLVEHLTAESTNACVELTYKADVTSAVVCNAGVLMSLVANLTRNALKYIGDGPVRRIEIRALDRGDAVRVEVEDTGPGLPAGLEERVFEPYVRGHGVTQAGIGLGLATVKRLAEAHRGTCGVRSVPGEGCTFWFELPKAPGEERVSAAVERERSA